MREAQRLAALSVRRVLDGSTLPVALATFAPAEREAQGRRRALVQELAYGTLRHWGTLDALVRMLATKPIADPALALSRRGRDLSARTHARAAVRRRRPRRERGGGVGASRRQGARQCAAAPLPAGARRTERRRCWRIRSRAGRIRAGGSIACNANTRTTGRTMLAAGNARAPLALRVNRRVATREALLSAFGAAGLTATPAGERGIIVEPRRGHPRDARVSPRGPSRCRTSAPSSRRRCCGCCRASGSSMRAPRPAARPRTSWSLPTSSSSRSTATRSAWRECARISSGCILRGPQVRVVAGDAGDARAMVGRAALRPHPRRRALHRQRRGSPPSRCQVAAARSRHRQLRRASRRGCSMRCGRASRPAGSCCTRPARSSTRKTRRRSPHSSRGTPEALRETLIFPPAVARRGAQLLPSLPGASHNQDGFFYALLRKP